MGQQFRVDGGGASILKATGRGGSGPRRRREHLLGGLLVGPIGRRLVVEVYQSEKHSKLAKRFTLLAAWHIHFLNTSYKRLDKG